MRKILSVLSLLSLLLVAGGVTSDDGWPDHSGVVKSAHAAGCGDFGAWTTIGYSQKQHVDLGGRTALVDVTVYDDGCGNVQPRWSQWRHEGTWTYQQGNLQNGTGGRFWICGALVLSTHAWGDATGAVAWGGWWRRGRDSLGRPCGPQADNAFGAAGYSTHGCTPTQCYDSGTEWPYGWYANIN